MQDWIGLRLKMGGVRNSWEASESKSAYSALIAQLGERQTEDLKALCSIHSQSTSFTGILTTGTPRAMHSATF